MAMTAKREVSFSRPHVPTLCVTDILFNMAMLKIESLAGGLVGPTIKSLYFFGIWRTGTRFRTAMYDIVHVASILFVCSQAIDLYLSRHDMNQVLMNMSVSSLSIICIAKLVSYLICQNEWRSLVENVSLEEKRQLKKQDEKIEQIMEDYKKYTRVVTFLFWIMVFSTNLFLILTPLLKYVSSKNYRDDIRSGVEPLPQIMCSWFPFDNSKMPGYFFGVCFHILMGSQGAGVLAAFDMTAVAIMTYLKGQMTILKEKCTTMFHDVHLSDQDLIERIKEVHRHHNVLIAQYKEFNALLSPNMFLYVFLCSITICCSVVQFTSSKATPSQKLWVVQYCSGLVSQLFLYCWHSNEVALKSKAVDMGVYGSQWWRVNKRTRRQVLLLAGKLNHTLELKAGPFATLSVPTFISILKGSYSFYTLFSQMQE